MGGPNGQQCMLSLSLMFPFAEKKREKKREVRKRFMHGVISRSHKNELKPRKMEWARMQDVNSKSFEFNPKGVNKG